MAFKARGTCLKQADTTEITKLYALRKKRLHLNFSLAHVAI